MRLEMMERTMIDALPTTLATPSEQAGELTKVTSRPLPRWLLVVGFWTLIVLAYTTRGEVRTGSYEGVRISWRHAVKAAAPPWAPRGGVCGGVTPWERRTAGPAPR